MPLFVYIAAGTFIALLSGIAIYLQWKLYLQKQQTLHLLAEQNAAITAKRQDALHSLNFIGRAYLADQVELAEASIRIHHLMDFLGPDEKLRSPFKVYDKISAEMAHIPIMKEWKALDKKERNRHLVTIKRIEGEYEDFAKEAAKQLMSFKLDEHKPTA